MPNILNDQSFNGSTYDASVTFVVDDGVRYRDKYIIAVSQYSLSREAYDFFQLVNQQLSIDGDIFDPPPATIRGNIINLDDPDKNVIGYFRASDVRQDTLVLYSNMMKNPASPRIIRDDCRTVGNATTEVPDFWF